MAISTNETAREFINIVADVPIDVPFPLFAADEAEVYFGNAGAVAAQGTDYTVTLMPDDFDTFQVTPTDELLAKIDALITGGDANANRIVVRRTLALTTTATPGFVQNTRFTSREFDRVAMKLMQIDERNDRGISLGPSFVGKTDGINIDEIVPGKALVWNDTGDGIVTGDASGGGGSSDATTLNGQSGAYYLDRSKHTGTQEMGTIAGLLSSLSTLTTGLANVNAKFPEITPGTTGYAITVNAAEDGFQLSEVGGGSSLPAIGESDAAKVVSVKADLSGYELTTPTGGGGDLPAIAPNSMLVSNAAGNAREEKTFQQVTEVFNSQVWTSQKYRTMKERARDVCHLLDFIANMTGSNDDTAKVQAWLNEADACGVAEAPRGIISVSSTLYVPKGLAVLGAGQRDQWTDGSTNLGSSKLGTTFTTVGSGDAMRWTDINGSDPADDTPVFVARGNNVRLENLSVVTGMSGQPRWSMGVLIPTVRQCKLRNVSAFGFSDGALYIDATGSDKNTTLKTLHPQIEYEPGMNEFNADNCWFEGGGTAGFGIKIQGTTRAGNVVGDVNSWLWAGGGTSDIDINNTRLGSNAPNGGCYSHDAQLYDANNGAGGNGVFGRGISMNRVGFRASGGGKYCIKLDRSDGHCFIHPYAEGQNGSEAEIAITSRTQTAQQGILFLGERMISGRFTVDGVTVNNTNRRRWNDTRCVSFIRQRGEISGPNFGAGVTTQFDDAPYIVSYEPNGLIRFMSDDGNGRTQRMRMTTSFLRPETPNAMTLGDKPRRWLNGFFTKIEVGDKTLIRADDEVRGVVMTEAGQCAAFTDSTGAPLVAARPNNGPLITFGRAGSSIASISVSSSTISYATSSDMRMKEDLRSIDLDLLDKISAYDFKWKGEERRGHGVMAQHVEGVVPDLVTKERSDPDDENSDFVWGVDYSKLVPLLITAIKDLRARVAELEGK